MTTKGPVLDDHELHDRIRRSLHTVAAHVGEEGAPHDKASDLGLELTTRGAPVVTSSRRAGRAARRGLAAAAALLVLSLGFLGWKQLGEGDIERIPTEAALVHGSADGFEWWLIPSAAIGHTNPCGVPMPGVEMVSAALNRPGEQWNTGGVNYGLHSPAGTRSAIDDRTGAFTYDCENPQSDFNEEAWLSDPSLHEVAFMRLGRNDDPDSPWAGLAAVHPSIDEIDVVADGRSVDSIRPVPNPERVDGPRYAGFDFPAETCDLELHYRDGTDIVTTDLRRLC